MLTRLLQSLALGLSFGLVCCGSDDNSPLFRGGGATGGTGGRGPGSVGGTTADGGNDTVAAGGSLGGVSTGGTTATGGSGSANAGMGGAANGGSAGSGGAVVIGTPDGGSAGSGGAGASSACMPVTPLTGGTQHCSSNMQGNVGAGYSYTIWSSGSGGCITPYGVGAAFKATWNDSMDFLARVGLALGSNKTHDQIGTFSADYAETKTGTADGYSFIGIYGWSVDPLREYYIVDDWFGSRPNPGTKMTTITVDGGTYDILTHTQTNQPSITGMNATFVQFWSVRQAARHCGHISISEHFKAWAKAGMTLGNMEECRILVEVGGGMGSIDFTTATLVAK